MFHVSLNKNSWRNSCEKNRKVFAETRKIILKCPHFRSNKNKQNIPAFFQ